MHCFFLNKECLHHNITLEQFDLERIQTRSSRNNWNIFAGIGIFHLLLLKERNGFSILLLYIHLSGRKSQFEIKKETFICFSFYGFTSFRYRSNSCQIFLFVLENPPEFYFTFPTELGILGL